MKPQFKFYFQDTPHRVELDTRERVAGFLRGYRRKPRLFTVRRVGLHHYTVATGLVVGIFKGERTNG